MDNPACIWTSHIQTIDITRQLIDLEKSCPIRHQPVGEIMQLVRIESFDRFQALLELAEVLPGSTTEIFEIVNAEAAVFFAGDRSAEDTAKVIQSRVSLYLSEQG